MSQNKVPFAKQPTLGITRGAQQLGTECCSSEDNAAWEQSPGAYHLDRFGVGVHIATGELAIGFDAPHSNCDLHLQPGFDSQVTAFGYDYRAYLNESYETCTADVARAPLGRALSCTATARRTPPQRNLGVAEYGTDWGRTPLPLSMQSISV